MKRGFLHFSFSCGRLRHVLRARNFPNSNTTGGAVSFPAEIEGYANVFDAVARDWTKRTREGERTLGARLLSRALQRFGSSLIPDTNQSAVVFSILPLFFFQGRGDKWRALRENLELSP